MAISLKYSIVTNCVLDRPSQFDRPVFDSANHRMLSLLVSKPSPPPMNTPDKPNPVSSARALLKDLQEKFAAFRNCLPLSIGIDKQIIARIPDVDRKVLRIALGSHTKSLRYLKQMDKAVTRFDLDGNPAEAITEIHRVHASKTLAERSKQDEERRVAKRKAEAAQRREEEEAKATLLRAEKLRQLTEKFSVGHGR